jgi:hypothetical protein
MAFYILRDRVRCEPFWRAGRSLTARVRKRGKIQPGAQNVAAMLERNATDGKATPSNIPPREVVRCPHEGCEVSYTLSYTDEENYLHGTGKNVESMRHTATERVRNQHPVHFTRTYLWKGAGRGWVEADSLAARKVL